MATQIDKLIYTVFCGHVLDILRIIPDESIDCVVTSPPYFGLRKYDAPDVVWDGDPGCEHEWRRKGKIWNSGRGKTPGTFQRTYLLQKTDYAVCSKCGAWQGQLGLEPTLDLYLSHLWQITDELWRVLKKTGVVFWNHGDCYGTKASLKCLLMQNYRFILGLTDPDYRGLVEWRAGGKVPGKLETNLLDARVQRILRNQIIWHKRNHLPSSVKDRFANAYEPTFMLTKNRKYWFDLDAVRVPHKEESLERRKRGVSETHKYADTPGMGGGGGLNKPRLNVKKRSFNYRVREAKKGKTGIVGVRSDEEEMSQYDRKGMRIPGQDPQGIHRTRDEDDGECLVNPLGKNPGDVWTLSTEPSPKRDKHYAAFPTKLVIPMIKAGCPPDGILLDPFAGTGRALAVAQRLGRKWIGIDLSPNYADVARRMTNQMTFDQVKESLF